MLTLRLNTSDEKVYTEIFKSKVYERHGIKVEPSDKWLDLGGNCGMFALYCLTKNVLFVRCVEPETENFNMIQINLGKYPNVELINKAVDVTSGTKRLYIAVNPENKWRHTLLPVRNRNTVEVETITLDNLLDNIDCIKMDIEGSEIELLETIDLNLLKNIKKLVFEYSFDKDRSIPRFLGIIQRLESVFSSVTYDKVNPLEKNYKYYPACTNIYCKNKKQVTITKKHKEPIEIMLNGIVEVAEKTKLKRYGSDRVRRGVGTVTNGGTSIPFGYMKVMRCKGELRANKLFPELYEKLVEFGKTFVPLEWNAIMFNYNFKTRPHKDPQNVGNSYIIGFGNYTGGELVIEGDEFDIRHKPQIFNGYLKQHWTKEWVGNRYSIVYFKSKL